MARAKAIKKRPDLEQAAREWLENHEAAKKFERAKRLLKEGLDGRDPGLYRLGKVYVERAAIERSRYSVPPEVKAPYRELFTVYTNTPREKA